MEAASNGDLRAEKVVFVAFDWSFKRTPTSQSSTGLVS